MPVAATRSRRCTARSARARRRAASSKRSGATIENERRRLVRARLVGLDGAAGQERHALAQRLGVEQALVDRAVEA